MSSQQPNGLSAKQDRFAREYLVDLNATQASIRAGYSEKTAKQQGSRLLTNADVKTRINELQEATAERLDMTADKVMADLEKLCWAAVDAGQYGPAIRAKQLQGQRLGLFLNRVEISETGRLSDEQLIQQVAGDDKELAEKLRQRLGKDGFE